VPQKPTWWLGGFLELRVKGETRHAYPNGWKLCGHKAVQEVGLDVVVPGPYSRTTTVRVVTLRLAEETTAKVTPSRVPRIKSSKEGLLY
jgi:hypothetical protein